MHKYIHTLTFSCYTLLNHDIENFLSTDNIVNAKENIVRNILMEKLNVVVSFSQRMSAHRQQQQRQMSESTLIPIQSHIAQRPSTETTAHCYFIDFEAKFLRA